MSPICNVDVWLVSLDDDPESNGQPILSPDERIRAARFRFDADRARWIRAHAALRVILSGCTGLPAAEIRFVAGPHGKPAFSNGSGTEFSLSHSGSWAMVAVTRGVPVGVDIERIRESVDIAALLRRLGETDLPEDQAACFNAWTRREAMTKALGGALMETPTGDLRTCDLEAPEGYSAALALIGHSPCVRRHNGPVLPSGTIPGIFPGPFTTPL